MHLSRRFALRIACSLVIAAPLSLGASCQPAGSPASPKPHVAIDLHAFPPSTPADCHIASSMRFEGAEHLLWEGEDNREEVVERAIAEQASIDLSCPRESIRVLPERAGFARRAEGCERGTTYLRVSRFGVAHEELEGRVPCTDVTTIRFVRLDRDPLATLTKLDADYAGPRDIPPNGRAKPLFSDAMVTVSDWSSLVVAGARDLACPPDRIEPGFWPGRSRIPIAEGCGKRATYLPTNGSTYALQSLVPLPPRGSEEARAPLP